MNSIWADKLKEWLSIELYIGGLLWMWCQHVRIKAGMVLFFPPDFDPLGLEDFPDD